MENFKFVLVSIIIIAGLSLAGYWAFRTLEPGDAFQSKQKIAELQTENAALTKQISDLGDQVATLESQVTPAPEPAPLEPPTTTAPVKTTTTGKYQSLINDLQKLIAEKVYMKVDSQGTRVGTIQAFLNIYLKTSTKVDNDFGESTKTDLMKFQKDQGISADGQTGPATYQKMIDWLKKQ